MKILRLVSEKCLKLVSKYVPFLRLIQSKLVIETGYLFHNRLLLISYPGFVCFGLTSEMKNIFEAKYTRSNRSSSFEKSN